MGRKLGYMYHTKLSRQNSTLAMLSIFEAQSKCVTLTDELMLMDQRPPGHSPGELETSASKRR